MPFLNVMGQRFGRLVAVRRAGKIGTDATWLCRCDCGKLHTARLSGLRRGSTKSCGCWRHERLQMAASKINQPSPNTPEIVRLRRLDFTFMVIGRMLKMHASSVHRIYKRYKRDA